MRWNDPSTTTSEIKTPAIGALIQDGMPISDPAAEMPAYSAQMVPKFANSRPITATYPSPRPQRSRMMPTNPLPVAAPTRTASRWKRIEQDGRGGDDPQQPVAVIRAEHGVGRDAGRIVVREPGEEPRAEDGQEGRERAESRRPQLRESTPDAAPDVRHAVERRSRLLAAAAGDAVCLRVKLANAAGATLSFLFIGVVSVPWIA